MENQLDFIAKFANSMATTTNDKYTIFAGVFFVIFIVHVFYKWFRGDHHLAAFTFNPNLSNNDNLYCAVCLHDVTGGEKYRRLPECKHCFHVDCIDAWFESHSTCPLCRSHVSHTFHQHQHEQSFLTHFLSFSQKILWNVCNPLNYELTLNFCENLRYIS
ncbi:uncharacterized protein LOC132279463 [Cornus florida]|uniref:uncharacterized protein LOC132279463 n=1 Tax=Cornus florida TaxID=4283 RepID=UPI002898F081|nr:uncharacterized protein LOC132279463 [Cornus florida]